MLYDTMHRLFVSCLVLASCLVFHSSRVNSTLLGIDFGTERVKVASVAPGRLFDIVLDETSKRSHPNLMVWDDDVRHYGSSAAGLESRRPLSAFRYFTRALGKRANSTLVSDLRKSYILNDITEDKERHVVRFASPYYDASAAAASSSTSSSSSSSSSSTESDSSSSSSSDSDSDSDSASSSSTSDNDSGSEESNNDEAEVSKAMMIESYSVEELAAMKLAHIKNRAEEAEPQKGTEIRDCVMTVPAYYSDKERQALLDSADLAGFNVLSLVNENTAAAVMFALNQNSENATNESNYYVFYNLGSFSTQVSLIRFFTHEISSGKYVKKTETVVAFEVIQHEWDEFLGGVNFDRIISDMIYQRISDELNKLGKSESEQKKILSNTRTLTRIRTSATKAKIVLSANKETRVYMESLFDGDQDFGMVITRQEFEDKLGAMLPKVVAPIDRIMNGQRMASFNITSKDIEGIVLIGGGARVPLVKEKLANYFEGRDLLTTLNADEAPVMGSIFHAANLSSSFKPKHVGMDDIISFPVGVHVTDLNLDDQDASETTQSSSDNDNDDDDESKEAYSKRGHLFDKYNRLRKRRSLSLKHTKDLRVELYYETEDADGNEVRLPTDTTPELVEYEITGVERAVRKYLANDTSYNVTDKPKVALSFLLDQNSQVQLVSATAIFQEQVMVKVGQKDESKKESKKKKKDKKSKKSANQTDEAEDGAAKSDDESGTNTDSSDAATDDTEKKSEDNTDTESDTNEAETDKDDSDASSADDSGNGAAAEEEEKEEESTSNTESDESSGEESEQDSTNSTVKEEEEEVQYELKTRKHRVPLKIKRIIEGRTVLPYSKKNMEESLDVLEELEKRDNAVRAMANAQNALESYIFESRSRVYDDDVEKVSTEDERDEIIGALTKAEDWIWESEDEEKNAKTFKSKLNELKALTKDVFRRSTELEKRPKSVKLAQKSIKQLYEFIEILRENYTWIEETETNKLEERAKSTEEWLSEKLDEQKGKSLTENPAFYSTDIDMRMAPLMKFATTLMSRKPSKEWKKAQREKAKKAAAAANATNATGETESDDGSSESDDTPSDDSESEKEEESESSTDDSDANADAADEEQSNTNAEEDTTTTTDDTDTEKEDL